MLTVGEMVASWGLQIDLSETQMQSMTRHITGLIDNERERCAKIVLHPNAGMVPPDGGSPTDRERMENIAADIRGGGV